MCLWMKMVKKYVKLHGSEDHFQPYGKAVDEKNHKTQNDPIKKYIFQTVAKHKNMVFKTLKNEKENMGKKSFEELWDDAQKRLILMDFKS